MRNIFSLVAQHRGEVVDNCGEFQDGQSGALKSQQACSAFKQSVTCQGWLVETAVPPASGLRRLVNRRAMPNTDGESMRGERVTHFRLVRATPRLAWRFVFGYLSFLVSSLYFLLACLPPGTDLLHYPRLAVPMFAFLVPR